MVTSAMKLKDSCSWKKSYDKPRQSIKMQRHHWPTKVHLVKAMVFPVVMYGCDSWTIKKAEHRRTDAFELWCWRRLLRVSWRSNQSILKEINPEYSLDYDNSPVKVGPYRRLSVEKSILLNCGAGEDSREILELQGDQTSLKENKGNQS